MSREEALEKALEELKEIRFNLNYKVNGTSRFDEALNMAIEALEAESRMHLVQEAVNAIINTCNTDSITDKAMRNAAKFVQNAIDGSYPDFEKLEIGCCKDCKYFEYDSVAKVDGIPLIVAHEICKRWGDGCKSKEDGYCFLFEPKMQEVKE